MIILSIEEVDADEDFVYDLETEAGTFLAGTRETGIMVKNTDSCMVDFKLIQPSNFKNREEYLKAHFEMGIKCADHCTAMFKQPIRLEFEKVMYPAVFITPKRYVTRNWKAFDKPDKEATHRGTQVVRKDYCEFLKDALKRCFNVIMEDMLRDKLSLPQVHSRITEIARDAVKRLLNGEVPVKDLIITKQLKGSYSINDSGADDADDQGPDNPGSKKKGVEVHWTDPRIKQAHVSLAQKLALKDAFNHPRPPDRVPYVFYKTDNPAANQCDRVVSPDDIRPGGPEIDVMYYFSSQFSNPFTAFLEIIGLSPAIYDDIVQDHINRARGQKSIDKYLVVSAVTKKEQANIDEIIKKPEVKKRVRKPVQANRLDGYFAKDAKS